MLASRGLREDESGRPKRIAGEFLVAIRRQAMRVIAWAALATVLLLAATLALGVR